MLAQFIGQEERIYTVHVFVMCAVVLAVEVTFS